jgi:hypothetical protein
VRKPLGEKGIIAMTLYHLTPSENASEILKEGIKADEEGNIFAFTEMIVANEIAKNQVFTERYCVFRISRRGIKGEILKDNVAEFSACFQRIIKQDHIEPKFLRKMCEEDTVLLKPTAWDYMIGARLGETKEQTDAKFAVIAWDYEQRKKGKLSEEEIVEETLKRFGALYEQIYSSRR